MISVDQVDLLIRYCRSTDQEDHEDYLVKYCRVVDQRELLIMEVS